ncbi:MFS transporter [Candidatus Peribacteria bacterium]|nr:MFS transporter [Candidatus Peribacteria bacterium]
MQVVNKHIKFLLSTNGVILFSGALLGPIYALFVEEIGGDILDAGLAGAVFALSAGLTSLIVGFKGDTIQNKAHVLALGYGVIALGFFSYTFVNSMTTLLVAQVIVGFGEALYSPMFDALYSRHLDEGHFSSEWEIWECMNYWVSCIAALIGAFFVEQYGFTLLFIVMGILALLSAIRVLLWSKK